MAIDAAQLKLLLIGSNVIAADKFAAVEKEAIAKNISLEEYLPQSGLIHDVQMGQIIANYLKVGFADLSRESIADEALAVLPDAVAHAQSAVVFKIDEEKVHVASTNPNNAELAVIVEGKTGKKAVAYYATPLALREAFRLYKGDLASRVAALAAELTAHPENEQRIVELVNLLIEYAQNNRASDIHIEPGEDQVFVRFRIDGVLHEVLKYPKILHDRVVFRIKIMSKLRTDEHAAAQDGRFDFATEDARFDVRVSILPITHGENVVLRLLAESNRRIMLEDLGLFGTDLAKVKKAADRPYGMILAVGPTGAGKTTTLYSILQILNDPEVNITTIEDPVEYNVEHVQQTQVSLKKDLTFATGLRSIVRQDPDIILVGEIRDEETAGIAVNAAMTGHLLLSTLHANDAATAFIRLIDMGIEPFLVASSVNVIIAQRLLRKVCMKCNASYHLSKEELALLSSAPDVAAVLKRISGREDIDAIRYYKGMGKECLSCAGTGYVGRIGVFETMEVTEELQALITQKAPAEVIAKKAVSLGMTTMLDDALSKVLHGVTTLEEVIRNIKS